jgi:hypothetical protein
MLGEPQTLSLVMGADPLAIDFRRRVSEPLEDQPADGLAMLQDEGDLAGADLQHRA